MPRLVLRDRRVAREREAFVALTRQVSGIAFLAVVGVRHVTGGAAALAEVAADVVGTLQPETGIVEPRLEQGQVDTGDLELRAARAGAGSDISALEDTERISRTRDLPARQRKQFLEHPVGDVLRRQLTKAADDRRRVDHLAAALNRREGLAVHRYLRRLDAVVVQARVIDHRIRGHDRAAHALYDVGVTVSAHLVRHAQVRGIRELDELWTLEVDGPIRGTGVCGGLPQAWVPGQDVCPLLLRLRAIAAVTLDTRQLDVLVHRLDARVTGFARSARGGRGRPGLGGRRPSPRPLSPRDRERRRHGNHQRVQS